MTERDLVEQWRWWYAVSLHSGGSQLFGVNMFKMLIQCSSLIFLRTVSCVHGCSNESRSNTIDVTRILHSRNVRPVWRVGQSTSLWVSFDSVNHDTLLLKTSMLGITGPLLQWLHCYLFGRKHKVSLYSCSSSCFQIRSGVPQGSILGPLLFFQWHVLCGLSY